MLSRQFGMSLLSRQFGMSFMAAAAALMASSGDVSASTGPLHTAYKALNYGFAGRNKYDYVPVNRTQEEARRVLQANQLGRVASNVALKVVA